MDCGVGCISMLLSAVVGCFCFVQCVMFCVLFFFFQAEDGIRDDLVTGVQTCALPIYLTLKVLMSQSKALCIITT